MSRPREHDGLVSSGMRLPRELHQRLKDAAADRDVSVNWLVTRAVEYYLDRLLPPDEVQWTRDKPAKVADDGVTS